MSQILNSLAQITNQYSIFEENQVLTHAQLNTIADHLTDQERLTRVKLLGVGIVDGLRVSLRNQIITVTEGIGLTTDGDLLYFEQATEFDRFKVYDDAMPRYAPFFVEDAMMPVYELVARGTEDDRAILLTEFTSHSETSLERMVAVLFMESYIKDDDLCSGTDCDNLGQDCIHTQKLLIIPSEWVDRLRQEITTSAQAFDQLNELTIDRPKISAISSLTQLVQLYRDQCTNIHNKLIGEWRNFWTHVAPILSDIFPSNPAGSWETQLITIRNQFSSTTASGIQYYYDFLKDVAETYNHFRDRLFDEMTWSNPTIAAFPKHLLLGSLATNSQVDSLRTEFYPSPLISQTAEQRHHARFLIQKLNLLIQSFQIPTGNNVGVRITPSQTEACPLEDRAIPYYYNISRSSLHRSWNYRLYQRRMADYNYSYHAGLPSGYPARGGAADPFNAQLGKFSFFRIEGHVGKNVTTVKGELEQTIAANNLPFTVQAVLLGSDRTQVEKRPGIRYSDLHRFHHVLRRDAFQQLSSVENFSQQFTAKVNTNVATDEDGANDKKRIAEQSNATITTKSADARNKLNLTYSQYRTNPSWKADLTDVLNAAGQFKYGVGEVIRTEFVTPFDTIISNTHLQWLDWLDDLIQQKEAKDDEKLLFSKFITQHPAMEHFGGVCRGGTLVLVHDAQKNIVADFMLPYYVLDRVDEEDEPEIPKPGIRPDWSRIDNGIRVLPSREKLFKDFDRNLRRDFDSITNSKIDDKVNVQQRYADLYREYIESATKIFTTIDPRRLQTQPNKVIADSLLDAQLVDAHTKRRKLDLLRERAARQDLPDTSRQILDRQILVAEEELGRSVQDMATYVATFDVDVSVGSEGYLAMNEVSTHLGSITNREVRASLQKGLSGVEETTQNDNLKLLVGSLRNQLGRR
ncbi:hypothetical protein [Pantanalinema sp. GBBB05]|uniref:hypothetical protein n=1 Tax=Pantanalinema sp. GBBB05 TaxID=2604139 RepID=UPI001D8ABDBB|nr:hypothetical protein [Pantanalinema sp. GBBB05]